MHSERRQRFPDQLADGFIVFDDQNRGSIACSSHQTLIVALSVEHHLTHLD